MVKKIQYNFTYLKYFFDAARLGSVSLSAKENCVTQSAISQGIIKLEKSLNQELLTHRANRFQLTYEGKHLFEKSLELFSAISNFEDALVCDPEGVSGQLEFACSHSFALAVLPEYLKKVRTLWPKLHVNFRLAHTDVIRDLVKKGTVDFGFVLDNEDFSSFDTLEIYKGEHRLYSLKGEDETDPKYILSEDRLETNHLRRAFLKKFKKKLPVLMEVSSWEVIARLVEEGLGIGFLPDYVTLNRKETLQEHSIELLPFNYRLLAILPLRRKIPAPINAFLLGLRKYLKAF